MQAGYFPWASIQELCYATSCTERELTLSINKLDFGAELASTCFGWNMCGCLVWKGKMCRTGWSEPEEQMDKWSEQVLAHIYWGPDQCAFRRPSSTTDVRLFDFNSLLLLLGTFWKHLKSGTWFLSEPWIVSKSRFLFWDMGYSKKYPSTVGHRVCFTANKRW